jgi:5-methylcytosine-specific restriction endonuclease McrA
MLISRRAPIKRKTRLSRRPKASRKKQKLEADRLFSLIIRTRDDWECRNCHSTQNIQCAHVVSRSYLGTRWDGSNAVALCQRCHMKFTYDPIAWEDWCQDRWPDRMAGLKYVARSSTRPDYDELLPRLRNRLANLQAGRKVLT